MEGGRNDERVVDELRGALAGAVARLLEAGSRDEALAEFVPARRVMLVSRPATMVSLGRVWRLGVLLLARDGSVYATGTITRALEPGRPAYQSRSAETRRDYRAAAFRAKFPLGETVNFDATPIPLEAEALRGSAGVLFLECEHPMVRWNPAAAAAAVPLETYLADRVSLLTDPPEGA